MTRKTKHPSSGPARHDVETPIDPLETNLERSLPVVDGADDRLHAAMRYAVLGNAKRLRPRLLLATAQACHGSTLDGDLADLTMRAAVAVELVHSASLVHDDLPCFDNAELRRGRASVHRAFGVPMAVLVGDALITQAFEVIAAHRGRYRARALRLVALLAHATGSAHGIIGGQSLELRPPADEGPDRATSFIAEYHQKKTAALFDFAMRSAAVAVGCSRAKQRCWGDLGMRLGLAFQLIDDFLDLYANEGTTGKTTGRDRTRDRPNGVVNGGVLAAAVRVSHLLDEVRHLTLESARDPRPVLHVLAHLEQSASLAMKSAMESPMKSPTCHEPSSAPRSLDPHGTIGPSHRAPHGPHSQWLRHHPNKSS